MSELFPRHFSRIPLEAGEFVFHLGDPGDAVYLIESGSCEVLLPAGSGHTRIATLAENDLFGEVALLDGRPRTASVRAVKPTLLMRIDSAYVRGLLQDADPLIRYLLQLVLARFRSGRTAQSDASFDPDGVERRRSLPDTPLRLALQGIVLARDLEEAIASGHLALHYQPIVELSSGAVAGFEALLRWNQPAHGLILPDRFIPHAERTGTIRYISQWVLNRALEEWPRLEALCKPSGPHPGFVSINLSAPELADPGIVDAIGVQLRRCNVAPAHLRIEMTETTMVSDPGRVGRVIERLRSEGVGVSLDDFGTGHAGLSTLQALPVSCLKIDRAFVAQLGAAERSLQIVKSAIELARPLGLSTVAEGVEDGATAQRLHELGCTYAQGYHYARPLPIDELAAWAAARSA